MKEQEEIDINPHYLLIDGKEAFYHIIHIPQMEEDLNRALDSKPVAEQNAIIGIKILGWELFRLGRRWAFVNKTELRLIWSMILFYVVYLLSSWLRIKHQMVWVFSDRGTH